MRRGRDAVRAVAACLVAVGAVVALPAQTHAAGPEVVTGTYHELHLDKIPAGRKVDVLVSGGKAYEVHLPAGAHPRSGAQVRVTGGVSGSLVAATSVQEVAAPPAAATIGSRRLLVIDLAWGTQSVDTTRDVATAFVFGDDVQRRSTAQYYHDVSYGQLTWTGDVTPTLTIPDPGGCGATDAYGIAAAADQAATAAGFSPSAYDNVMYNLPAPTCASTFTGLGEISGTRSWVVNGLANLSDGYARMIPAHELGHNLGLWHGHGLECGPQLPTTACLAATGAKNEYGSSYDLMGNNWTSDDADAVNSPAFPQMLRLGWINGRYADVSDPGGGGGGDYDIAPVEQSAGQVGLRITTATRVYYVEYRRPLGQDAYLTRFPDATSGVLISMRDDTPGGDDGPLALDTTPDSSTSSPYGWSCADLASYCDFFDAGLGVGRSFADVDGRFTLTVASAGPSGAVVHVAWAGQASGVDSAANPSVDFDGDGRTDLGSLYRGRSPADSLWFGPSSGAASIFQIYFGATSDVPVPGDYDGDGRTDAVIFRPSTGLWYGPRTGAASIVIQMNLGQAGDLPIPGDYDGDGKTDPAIYRPSTGMFFAVLSGGGTKSQTFGAPGDVPVPRDYDGDGKTDFAIYRANASNGLGLWYAPLSGGGVYQIYFGAASDVPVPGDYNGDGKAEAVIFRPSTGLWYGPFNGGGGLFQLTLGQTGDVPIPGYYDGDRSLDPTIYRKSTGLWFSLLSGGGVRRIDGLGLNTDVPVQRRPALAGG
jgi:Gametolysin peptidase M11